MSAPDHGEAGRLKLRGFPPILHPMAGCGYGRFWKHYVRNFPYNLRSIPSQLFSLFSVSVRAPGVFFEGRKHNAKIAQEPLSEGPVFLIGHWRSGTTHLHNLLSQDPQFACISFSRSAMPLDCLGKVRPARTLMNLTLPKTRGMDKVAINADTPQEEEMALGALGDVCFYKRFYFPRNLDDHFRRAVLLEDLKPGEREKLASDYRFLAQKMAYAHEGRQVLFKNPASTARMAFLKEVFPNAKFVHIVRDPYSVFASMMKLWPNLLNAFAWQSPKGIDFVETTLSIYERTMRAHLADREAIDDVDFHEVRFEDLESDPLGVVGGIYGALGLAGKDEAERPLRDYVAGQSGYKKNVHQLDAGLKGEIAERWGFAFERWGYGA